jgi:hypothetical protein
LIACPCYVSTVTDQKPPSESEWTPAAILAIAILLATALGTAWVFGGWRQVLWSVAEGALLWCGFWLWWKRKRRRD